MFSQKIYAEIARVTQKALDEMHNATTINQVTVILEHVKLSSRNVPGYDDELRNAIDRLLELARGENQQVLADALDALSQHMAQRESDPTRLIWTGAATYSTPEAHSQIGRTPGSTPRPATRAITRRGGAASAA